MFGMLKDWRRVHIRYDRRKRKFISAIAVAAIVTLGYDQAVLCLGPPSFLGIGHCR